MAIGQILFILITQQRNNSSASKFPKGIYVYSTEQGCFRQIPKGFYVKIAPENIQSLRDFYQTTDLRTINIDSLREFGRGTRYQATLATF